MPTRLVGGWATCGGWDHTRRQEVQRALSRARTSGLRRAPSAALALALLVVWAAHIGGEHLREDDDLLARLGGQAVQPLV